MDDDLSSVFAKLPLIRTSSGKGRRGSSGSPYSPLGNAAPQPSSLSGRRSVSRLDAVDLSDNSGNGAIDDVVVGLTDADGQTPHGWSSNSPSSPNLSGSWFGSGRELRSDGASPMAGEATGERPRSRGREDAFSGERPRSRGPLKVAVRGGPVASLAASEHGIPSTPNFAEFEEVSSPHSVRRNPFFAETFSMSDFKLGRQIGTGRYSTVYQAYYKATGVNMAMKMYHRHKMDPFTEHQVRREIRIHSEVDHENIAMFYGHFDDGEDNICLLQEWASRGDVFEEVKRCGGKLDEKRAVVDVIMPVLEALVYLHRRGVIHRDIKPENILLFSGRHGTKLSDFGFAIDNSERPQTRLGTVDYMSPELVLCDSTKVKSEAAYDQMVDAWAMGVLTYELLVGRPPFEAGSRDETYEKIVNARIDVPDNLSHDARDFIKNALSRQKDHRLDCEEMLEHAWIKPYRSRKSMLGMAAPGSPMRARALSPCTSQKASPMNSPLTSPHGNGGPFSDSGRESPMSGRSPHAVDSPRAPKSPMGRRTPGISPMASPAASPKVGAAVGRSPFSSSSMFPGAESIDRMYGGSAKSVHNIRVSKGK
eukprot:jgi/Mesvir1/17829/Mv12921-RA.1